jgi:hypothetical protein
MMDLKLPTNAVGWIPEATMYELVYSGERTSPLGGMRTGKPTMSISSLSAVTGRQVSDAWSAAQDLLDHSDLIAQLRQLAEKRGGRRDERWSTLRTLEVLRGACLHCASVLPERARCIVSTIVKERSSDDRSA